MITDYERAYYPGAAQDALRRERQTVAELRAALDQAEAELAQRTRERNAYKAERDALIMAFERLNAALQVEINK